MITALPKFESFRTQPLRGLPAAARVDRATRTIFGIKAMEVGPLSPGDERPWKIDEVTLQQAAKFASAKTGGVKMRFAHPNMSRDGMGTHVGRASNPRLVTDDGPAYLAIDATLSDRGGKRTQDMVEHVLDLAEVAPEDFGVSLAPLVDHEAMATITPDEQGLVPVRLKALQAIDFVDEPAATRGGLFDLHSADIRDLPAQATELLDTYFANASPDVIRTRFGEFLERYLQTRKGFQMEDNVPVEGSDPVQTPEEKIAALEAEIARLKAEIEALKGPEGEGEGDMAEDEKKPEEGMSAKKRAARDELKRTAEISALCKLAKVPDDQRALLLQAGFSRAEAQQYLATSGFLAANNPPIVDGGSGLKGKKETPEEKFAREYDEHKDIFARQNVSKEAYVKRRLKDAAREAA